MNREMDEAQEKQIKAVSQAVDKAHQGFGAEFCVHFHGGLYIYPDGPQFAYGGGYSAPPLDSLNKEMIVSLVNSHIEIARGTVESLLSLCEKADLPAGEVITSLMLGIGEVISEAGAGKVMARPVGSRAELEKIFDPEQDSLDRDP